MRKRIRSYEEHEDFYWFGYGYGFGYEDKDMIMFVDGGYDLNMRITRADIYIS